MTSKRSLNRRHFFAQFPLEPPRQVRLFADAAFRQFKAAGRCVQPCRSANGQDGVVLPVSEVFASDHRDAVFCSDSVRDFIDTATTAGPAADARRPTARRSCGIRSMFRMAEPARRRPPPPVRRASRRPRDAWAPPPGGAASPRAAAGRCAALCGAGGTRRRTAARYGGAGKQRSPPDITRRTEQNLRFIANSYPIRLFIEKFQKPLCIPALCFSKRLPLSCIKCENSRFVFKRGQGMVTVSVRA